MIERAFGVLKRRWQCLLKPLELNIITINDVVLACFILHNICIDRREPMVAEVVQAAIDEYEVRCGEGAPEEGDVEGNAVREAFVVYANLAQD